MTPPRTDDEPRPAQTTAATGDQWMIGHGTQRAVVCEVGATLRHFSVADEPVVVGFGPEEWSHGGRGQVLAPWPNRLGDGRYTFEGTTAQAPLDEVERHNAIHGLVRWAAWRMSGCAQNRVSLTCDLHPSPAYPYALRLTLEYRLGRDGLAVAATAENVGDRDLPFGLGFHPYFTVGTPLVDDVRLTVPAERRLVSDDRGLPVGAAPVAGTAFDFADGRLLGPSRLDTAYTGLLRGGDGRARVELDHPGGDRGLTLWVDEHFTHLMVFTGDTLPVPEQRRSLAVEPMTCPPDAFRSGTDLVVLRPGGRWSGSWGVIPRPAPDRG